MGAPNRARSIVEKGLLYLRGEGTPRTSLRGRKKRKREIGVQRYDQTGAPLLQKRNALFLIGKFAPFPPGKKERLPAQGT